MVLKIVFSFICFTPPSYQRHEPTIEHKYSLLESLASTQPGYLLAMESMQDHKQYRDDKSINQLDKVLNIHRISHNEETIERRRNQRKVALELYQDLAE
jgi:hypothetical protein